MKDILIEFAEYCYIKANKNNKGDCPSIVYEQVEKDMRSVINEHDNKIKQKTLDIIAEGQGWEETYDLFAKKLGLPTKFN